MGRRIVISDIHGMNSYFHKLIEKVKLKKEDKIILLGDYVDRGSSSKGVISTILDLKTQYDVELLKGNHDDWFLAFLESRMYNYELQSWFRYGGIDTIESYCGEGLYEDYTLSESREYILKNFNDHVEMLKNLKLYYEDEDNYYVHAGINPFLKNIESNNESDFYWMDRYIFLREEHCLDKVVIFGHTPIDNLDEYLVKKRDVEDVREPYIFPCRKKIAVDGGAVYGGRLNALIIENKEYKFEYVGK